MLIDTRYGKSGMMIVDIVLQSADEHALNDDSLARLGYNQHLLDWPDEGANELKVPNVTPAFFPLPKLCKYTVVRNENVVTISYPDEGRDFLSSGAAFALAASATFGFSVLMRYGDLWLSPIF